MKRITMYLFAFMLFCACGVAEGKAGFLPENDLYLEDSLSLTSNVSEADFDNIMNYLQYVYEPIVARFGARLQITGDWSDSTVNAYASNEGNIWRVQMFGGLARRQEVTFDGFVLVVCHELGHHIAGFPTYSSWQGQASNEGNSDYWATLVCGKKFFIEGGVFEEKKDMLAITDPYATAKCDRAYTSGSLKNQCYRTMNASMSLARLLGALNGERTVRFDTPDRSQVYRTSDSHPAAQCRLDTMAAGSVCNMGWNDSVIPRSESEAYNYSCRTGEGARSRCWFAPRM